VKGAGAADASLGVSSNAMSGDSPAGMMPRTRHRISRANSGDIGELAAPASTRRNGPPPPGSSPSPAFYTGTGVNPSTGFATMPSPFSGDRVGTEFQRAVTDSEMHRPGWRESVEPRCPLRINRLPSLPGTVPHCAD
jgi:hypothetical protein